MLSLARFDESAGQFVALVRHAGSFIQGQGLEDSDDLLEVGDGRTAVV